jgi:hypothetical protein
MLGCPLPSRLSHSELSRLAAKKLAFYEIAGSAAFLGDFKKLKSF